jgi:hypothetical protein
MIPLILTDLPQQDVNIFDCISIQQEIFIPAKEVPLIDYFVTVYPRNENSNPFPFVYGLFDSKDIAFSSNQEAILNIANVMFAGASTLDSFEQKILNYTFTKSIKDKPTISGRK